MLNLCYKQKSQNNFTFGTPFTPYPYFNFKPCNLQSEILLNLSSNSIPQYLMCMIQNNYGNNKHSSSEGVHGKKEKVIFILR
jgi:hypothetical protein